MKSTPPSPPDPDDVVDDLHDQIAILQEQVQALIASQRAPVGGGGLSEDALERILSKVSEATAAAQERAANPSNKTHPGISVFSYPEGDRARPRSLKCPMFWAGYDLGIDTTTAEEIELLNRAEPGVFTFQRTDRSQEKLTVTGERDAGGTITKLWFSFLVDERTDTLPGMTAMLRGAFHVKTPEELELAALRQQVEALKAERVSV